MRLDQARRKALIDLRAQVRDVGLDGARTHEALGTPNLIEELIAERRYDVVAISPRFLEASFGGAWGKGKGELTVSYSGTSEAFWRLVPERAPIAIMSFSRGRAGNAWLLHSVVLPFPASSRARGTVISTLPKVPISDRVRLPCRWPTKLSPPALFGRRP